MKKVIILLIPVVLMWSCQDKEKMSQMQSELAETNAELKERDSLMTTYIDFVTEIEKNLNEIREREALIELTNDNMALSEEDSRAKLIKDIKTINALMEENKQKIAVLNSRLNNADGKLKKFRSLIAQLEKNLEAKETELVALNDQLAEMTQNNEKLQQQVDSISSESTEQREMIAKQSEKMDSLDVELHTAYFVTGSVKELENKQLIVKEGGVLGLGSVQKLASSLDKDQMIPIDIRQTHSIDLDSKKVELVSNHPEESYEIIMNDENKEMDKLMIVDPDLFWSTSKYLVVVKK